MNAAAVFPRRREIQVIDYPEPQLASPTHVKLRVREVGICGTDCEICAFAYGTRPEGAGQLTKLVHNGIEFGMLQAIGEGIDLLEHYPTPLPIADVLRCWRHGFGGHPYGPSEPIRQERCTSRVGDVVPDVTPPSPSAPPRATVGGRRA